jgi:hypothetical protein
MKRLLVFAAVMMLLANPVFASELKSFESLTWPKAQAVVSLDRNMKNPVFSLDVAGKLFEGKASKIENQGNPVNVVFCIDASDSVGYNLKQLKPLIVQISGMFGGNDTYSLIIFSDKILDPVKFSGNHSDVALIVGDLEAQDPQTYLFDALDAAKAMLDTKPENKGLIFLLSDGEDTGSKAKDTISDKYPVIAIAPPANVKVRTLTGIAANTGGKYYSSNNFNTKELQQMIDDIKGWKNSLYTVDFENLPELSPGKVELKLIVESGTQKLELPVTFDFAGKPSTWWIWLVSGIIVAVLAVFLLLQLKKQHVPTGKKVVEKPPEDIHYLAWISLAEDEDRQLRIRKNKVLIGTDPNSDFYVDDPTVSVRHAQIIEKADGFYIQDAESVLGTFLNKKRVLDPQKLSDGDIIRVGDTDLKFTQSDFAYVSKKKVI